MIAGNSASAAQGAPPSFSAQLKQRTQALHVQAERSGFVQDMLRGTVTIEGYALFLRNLLPAYSVLEAGLERLRLTPIFRRLALKAVYRAPALDADLTEIVGVGWADRLELLPEAMEYADRIAFVAQGDGARLLAHAYARTLGDLNGGQVLKRLLARTLGLGAGALSFYEFPAIGELEAFRLTYRAALDSAAGEIPDLAPIIEEAAEAFRLNIALSEAVQRAVASNIILASAAD
jgi:heme oxygenase